jgi:predicted RNA-binding Zn-ribbon protein involved in translation (DUF1610 family)
MPESQIFDAVLLISSGTFSCYPHHHASNTIPLAAEAGHWKETRGKMASNSDRSRRELSHFHACVHCGNVSRRDEVDGTAVATGIYPCTKCGHDGPLNIVIRDMDAAATGTNDPGPSGSAG